MKDKETTEHTEGNRRIGESENRRIGESENRRRVFCTGSPFHPFSDSDVLSVFSVVKF